MRTAFLNWRFLVNVYDLRRSIVRAAVSIDEVLNYDKQSFHLPSTWVGDTIYSGRVKWVSEKGENLLYEHCSKRNIFTGTVFEHFLQ